MLNTVLRPIPGSLVMIILQLFSGIAGLSVTYGLNLNMLQGWVIWKFCNMENKIISVERVLQYMSISSEPSLVIEENRPDQSWPFHGELEIQDLKVNFTLITFFYYASV